MAQAFSFIKVRVPAAVLSVLAIAALFTVTFVRGGFNLGVDFKPGVSVQVALPQSTVATIDEVRQALDGLPGLTVQAAGGQGSNEFIVRVGQQEETPNYTATVESDINRRLGAAFGSVTFLGTNAVGARFSATLTRDAILLVSLALFFIALYVWFRFKLGFAVGAMVATIHDTIFVIGFIGATQMEITSATIAAVLTIIGYSLNDTVVIFDRIRENEKTAADQSLGSIIDGSLTQTLSRTVVTSLTTLLAVLAIAVFTQGEIQDFAIALIVGIIVGTYSSLFVASPVMLEWRAMELRNKRRKEAKLSGGVVVKSQGSADEHVDDPTEVDADAIAQEIRKQRSERKKI